MLSSPLLAIALSSVTLNVIIFPNRKRLTQTGSDINLFKKVSQFLFIYQNSRVSNSTAEAQLTHRPTMDSIFARCMEIA